MIAPLLINNLGPLFGGLVVENLGWRWVFWILTIVCMINTALGFFFLKETYAPVILSKRVQQYEKEKGGEYTFTGKDDSTITQKLLKAIQRPLKIFFTQPIVLVMAAYQALIFATMYTMFTNFQEIYTQPPYSFSTTQVGLVYLGPGLGFLVAVWFIVPLIDTTYNKLTEKNDGESKPEFRLPIGNIGAVLLPITLFW